MSPTPRAAVPSLRSMTGFGRAEVAGPTASLTVEARSVNHRHLDIAVRVPRALAAFELDVRRLVQTRLERGRVEVTGQLTPAPGGASQAAGVAPAPAAVHAARARQLLNTHGVPGA